jgi:hydroxyacylglutathione hydrolase
MPAVADQNPDDRSSVAGDQLYFRQLLSGRDFAVDDAMAAQMVNFAYLIGDRRAGQALIVDPAYAVDDLLAVAAQDGMDVVGVLASHHHPDHVGGSLAGYTIEGVSHLLAQQPVPVHAHHDEVASIRKITGAESGDVIGHDSGDVVTVGEVPVQLLHTPGHTPGSQCFLVDGLLVSGDTLFLEGCGRTDLPGSDPEAMYRSLQRLASLPDETAVFPGHRYSMPSSGTMDAIKQLNMVFKPATEQEWLAIFAGR